MTALTLTPEATSRPSWRLPALSDPRVAVALILVGYLALGLSVLGFNRSVGQIAITTATACALELGLARALRGRWIVPFSAMITSFSLSLLLDYGHGLALAVVPVFFAIGSKYLFTFDDRHALNPALAGVVFTLVFAGDLISAAPAYQWNGIGAMSAFMVTLALVFFLPRVRRGWLVASFLLSFTLLTALRAWIMRHHLPFETLFLGTLSSPAFFLFTFFMITDPATSPRDRRGQIGTGVAIAVVDLLFHIGQSYFTFFYAAFLVAGGKLAFRHARAMRAEGPSAWVRARALDSGYWRRPIFLAGLAGLGLLGFRAFVRPGLEELSPPLRFERVEETRSGIAPRLGGALERVDPKIHHVAKWIMSVGDSVAVGDYDGDGRPDLFFTFPLKRDEDRLALYRNLGDFRFERVPVPALEAPARDIEGHGLAMGAYFADLDEDGDQDLFLTFAAGSSRLLENRLAEEGRARFVDVTKARGLERFGNAMGAAIFDANADGRLDLFVLNVLPRRLAGYEDPPLLNLFDLPEPAYPGDERMYRFMHSSWHQSDNGGVNDLWLQQEDGSFERQDPAAWGLEATRWSLAAAAADLDHDGLTDLYVANDFGPDDFYLNRGGARFEAVRGDMFGSIGRDTYKGMNASAVDVDNDGWLDVYVSNVHHALQAEGSLLWKLEPGPEGVEARDVATAFGALNPSRFGWGAAVADLDNDGWADIAQANGMVDDLPDRRFEDCPDYWYVNEKVARSPPSIHANAKRWGDIRGYCIYGNELDRIYLNREVGGERRFVDVAEGAGVTRRANSRGVAAADLDGDGRLDLVITHQFRSPSLLRNVAVGEAKSWIRLVVEGEGGRCGRDGVGARVTVGAPGAPRQAREVQVSTGFDAQGERALHFGLGDAEGEVEVEVRWCDGSREVFELAPRRVHVVRPGG